MSIFRRRLPAHFIAVHPDNVGTKDWIIVLEAGTLVGPSPTRLRVARATQERTIVKKYNILLQPTHYLVLDTFKPRVQTVYFCPQLYRYDSEKKLVPLQGEEIGALIAQSIEGGVAERRPWYMPSESLPAEPIFKSPPLTEFDTVVVEMPATRGSAAG